MLERPKDLSGVTAASAKAVPAIVPAVIVPEGFKVPATAKVAPLGIVAVSPDVPISRAVPLWGSSLSTFNIDAVF